MHSLQSFQRLCETDRIALLKNSSFEVLYLLSIMRYNPAADCLTLPMQKIREQKFECNYEGMCSINILTRKFCQKCRLTKCLAIGMNEEYILNDEERHIRRMKVEAKRMALKGSDQTIDTPPASQPSSSSQSDTNNKTTNNTDDMFATNLNIDANNELDLDLDHAVGFGVQLIPTGDQQLMKIGTNNNDGNRNNYTDNSLVINSNDISDAVYHKLAQFELSIIPIARPLPADSNRMNDSECKVLQQWLSAAQKFAINISSDTETATLTDPLFGMKMFGHIFETQVRNIVDVVKYLPSFQRLCESDRIALLKNSLFEIMNLRSIINYNPADDYFTLPMGTHNSVILKTNQLKQVHPNVYEILMSYYNKMLPIMDSDNVILDLLSAIVLFNPNNHNLEHKDVIKLQQNIYMHLLKRYLAIKCITECESKTRFLRLMNTLQDINQLGRMQKENMTGIVHGLIMIYKLVQLSYNTVLLYFLWENMTEFKSKQKIREPKCRLTKCFAIGMKEEYILNDEERHIRRMKVEAKRMALKGSDQTIATPPTPHPSSSGTASSDETMTSFYSQYSETTNNTDHMFTTISTIDANNELDLDLDYAVDSGEQLIPTGDQQLMKIGSIDGNNNTDYSLVIDNSDISDDVFRKLAQFELSVIPIARPLPTDSNRMNDSECKVLERWISTAQLFKLNISTNIETATLSDPLFGQTMFGHILEKTVRNIVAVLKDLQSFQGLCESDRIALLKNSSFELMYLRSIVYYNAATDNYTLPMGTHKSVVIKTDCLKDKNGNVFGILMGFYNKMLLIMDSDKLSAIVLFNPDNDYLVHKEVIK
ncbi:unnamed protein product [Medioppia subpectinata]|uniref:NR LBD domain-containing protein n=1 Tax=Medioppia subpectinata TaxID=1979941 RepID=A0A7R9KF67_9ACAR|nr:unnamed protein product [Medioppia subpectinata]CAG2101239.1 unnamed protein product [Medioppia subpectinata]